MSVFPKLIYNIVKEKIHQNELNNLKQFGIHFRSEEEHLEVSNDAKLDLRKLVEMKDHEKYELVGDLLSNNLVLAALADLIYEKDNFDYKRMRGKYATGPSIRQKVNTQKTSNSFLITEVGRKANSTRRMREKSDSLRSYSSYSKTPEEPIV